MLCVTVGRFNELEAEVAKLRAEIADVKIRAETLQRTLCDVFEKAQMAME